MRDGWIKCFGRKQWRLNEKYDKYCDIEPPLCYAYLYNMFIELYNGCAEKITFQDIKCYCDVMKEDVSIADARLIQMMSHWAWDETEKLRKERNKG